MRRESPLPRETVERPALVWQRTSGAPVEFSVWPERPVHIGRDPTNTIVMDSPFVSKAHAVFRYGDGQYLVEDLESANGTRVNGAPIRVSVVQPGDVIEIGDQQLLFVDRAARAAVERAEGPRKFLKLGLVGLGALLAMVVVVRMLIPSAPQAPVRQPSRPGGQPQGAAAPQPAPPVPAAAPKPADSKIVRETVAQAKAAGVRAVDALYDAGVAQADADRYREAVDLFGAVLAENPKHPLAGGRLTEAQAALEGAIVLHLGQAERAFAQLQYETAIFEWELALLLIDSADPRYASAQAGIKKTRERSIR